MPPINQKSRKATPTYNLKTEYPEIAKLWHPSKNRNKKPEEFTHAQWVHVWWVCPNDHSYKRMIKDRVRVSPDYCKKCETFGSNYPEISKDWHPSKNKLKPEDFTPKDTAKVWWLCPECNESYRQTINRRVNGIKCLDCYWQDGRKKEYLNGRLIKYAPPDYNLVTEYPDIAEEFHPHKNGNLKAEDFYPVAIHEIWWLCPHNHDYEKSVYERTSQGTGCTQCPKIRTSRPELRIFTECKILFDTVLLNDKSSGKEIDIYLPDFKIGIEYDGSYHHSSIHNQKLDIEKNSFLKNKGIQLFRVRHKDLGKISKKDILVEKDNFKKEELNELFKKMKTVLPKEYKEKLSTYIHRKTFLNQKEYRRNISYLPFPVPEESLLHLNPDVAEEWDYEKNSPLLPEHFKPTSGEVVWWTCKDDEHPSFENKIIARTRIPKGNKRAVICIYCAGKKADSKNNLKVKFPEIAKEWHPTKNGSLKPENFLPSSHKEVWWQCPTVKNHEYPMPVSGKTDAIKRGRQSICVFCSGQRVHPTNSLSENFPEIAKEWHPTKNGELTPDAVTKRSGQKVWWLCSNGHSYKYRIADRTDTGPSARKIKNKCIECRSIAFNFPEIAKEWHPTKNGDLSTKKVFQTSMKVFWWLCLNCRKSYEMSVIRRTKYNKGCDCK